MKYQEILILNMNRISQIILGIYLKFDARITKSSRRWYWY